VPATGVAAPVGTRVVHGRADRSTRPSGHGRDERRGTGRGMIRRPIRGGRAAAHRRVREGACAGAGARHEVLHGPGG